MTKQVIQWVTNESEPRQYTLIQIMEIVEGDRIKSYKEMVETCRFVGLLDSSYPLENERQTLSYYPSSTDRERILNKFFKFKAMSHVPQKDGTVKILGPFDSTRRAMSAYRKEYNRQFGLTPTFAYNCDAILTAYLKNYDADFSKYDEVRRKDADDANLTFYFTGKRCRNGHVKPRYVKSGKCLQCSDEHSKSWRADNKDRVNELNRIRKTKKRGTNMVDYTYQQKIGKAISVDYRKAINAMDCYVIMENNTYIALFKSFDDKKKFRVIVKGEK